MWQWDSCPNRKVWKKMLTICGVTEMICHGVTPVTVGLLLQFVSLMCDSGTAVPIKKVWKKIRILPYWLGWKNSFLFFNSTRQLSKSNNLKCDIGTAVPLDNFWLKNGWFRPDLPKLAHQIVTVLVPLYPMARNKVKMGTLLWRFGHFTRLTKNAKNAIFQFSTWFLKTF